MAVAGSARTLLVVLAFAAGAAALLLLPVGALTDEAAPEAAPPTPPAVSRAAAVSRAVIVDLGPEPGPAAVRGYLDEVGAGGGTLLRGQALCALWRRQPVDGPREMVAVAEAGEPDPPLAVIAAAARRHLCPEVPAPR